MHTGTRGRRVDLYAYPQKVLGMYLKFAIVDSMHTCTMVQKCYICICIFKKYRFVSQSNTWFNVKISQSNSIDRFNELDWIELDRIGSAYM